MAAEGKRLPLIYACAGCSSAAQLANALAVKLDRERVAEMSCVAGVGGDVAPLVEIARSGRPIVVLDGCEFACALHCLERQGVAPAMVVDLSQHGVVKRRYAEYLAEDFSRLHAALRDRIAALDA